MAEPAESLAGPLIGRYALHGQIAAGGMATVHFGRLVGPAAFSRVVAIKRLHPELARDPDFVSMFFDEVRLAARIQHPNVVATLDALDHDGELLLVMEYVHGEVLSRLLRLARARAQPVPVRFASTIACDILHGLHAAHEARSETNEPLQIVHRDVSPQNVMVGLDGVARVLDFGIAKAAGRVQITRDGQIKGKTAYLAPENVQGGIVDRRSDVYGAAVVLWEAITGVRLFDGDNDSIVLGKVLAGEVPPLSRFIDSPPEGLQEIVSRGLDRDPAQRFATAREMALALHERVGVAPPSEVGDWVAYLAHEDLAVRSNYLARLERTSISERVSIVVPPSTTRRLGVRLGQSTAPPDSVAIDSRRSRVQPESVATLAGDVGFGRAGEGSAKADAALPTASPLGEVARVRTGAARRRPSATMALAASLLLVIGLVGLVFARATTSSSETAPSPIAVVEHPPAQTAPGLDSANVIAAQAPLAVESTPAAASLRALTGTPSTAPPAATALRVNAPSTAPPRLPSVQPSSAGVAVTRPGCRPPYAIDANGIKRFKVECL